jgi:hypothetical protein
MATDQVLKWIGGATEINETKISLSKPINSFETDFSNGYLIGEILQTYGLCKLDSFTNK